MYKPKGEGQERWGSSSSGEENSKNLSREEEEKEAIEIGDGFVEVDDYQIEDE